MNEDRELPVGWAWTTLGDIRSDRSQGIEPSKFPDQLFELYSVPSFEQKIPEVVAGRDIGSNKQIIEPGAVLLCKINPRINRAWVTGSYSNHLKIASTEWIPFFSLQEVAPSYLCYYLSLDTVRDYLAANASGVGGSLMRITSRTITNYPFPLAPLAEQQRIVSAIEQQFTRLDAGVAALKSAQARLKRYRAAVLKAAVEGKLTEAWRAEHPDTEPASVLLQRILAERRARWEADLRAKGKDPAKLRYEEPAGQDSTDLPELPQGWCWARIDQVGEVQLGRQRAPQHHTGSHMRPYLRVANVFEDRIDTSDVMTMNFTPEEFETYSLRYGDVLLNEGQSLELVGRPAMYRDEVPGACFQNTLVRFRAYPGLLPNYALIVFRAYLHSQRFQRIGKHTTNMAHLGAGRFAELEFPLPPSSEQERIVEEVERRLSVVGELEATVTANLKRAERLRQSILQEAFAGQLVPQDPNDEPASVLLERIHKDRGSNGRVTKKEKEREAVLIEARQVEQEEARPVSLWDEE